ncbi:MAG: autotransporter adhesin family protein [Treponema sp.]|jgi:hypothetical protein|nr:autotransporter adhesin family protein [Treponema sp.]
MNSIAPFRGKAFFVPAGVFLFALGALFFSACDVLNNPIKEDIEYNLSLHPVKSWTELESAIDAVPPGGRGTFTLMTDIEISSPKTITGKTVALEAYAGTKGTMTIRRTPGTAGSFFTVNSGGKLTLGGNRDPGTLVLDGEGAGADPLVEVTGGNLTLNGGAELRNNGTTGVDISGSGSSFTMNGGTISENAGNGVRTGSGATFIMNGGTISGNTVNDGAVSLNSDSFIMNGGSISGNSAPVPLSSSGCSGVTMGNSTFTMRGGTISGNNAWRGGGVNMNNHSTFIMYEGSITGNNAWETSDDGGGGGVFLNLDGGTFEMRGGTISGNTAEYGAGVYVQFTTTFTMRGGTVAGNRAGDKGGGVYVQYDRDWYGSAGIFEMYGGSVTGNTAVSNGGGVYLQGDSAKPDGGKLTMSGGTIGGNTAVNGAGVYAGDPNAHFTMSGSAAALSNNIVYLSGGRTIAVTGALNPPGGIAAVIKSPGGPGTILVTGESPYVLTAADVGKFRYDNAGTPTPLVFSSTPSEAGSVPP